LAIPIFVCYAGGRSCNYWIRKLIQGSWP